MDLSKLLSGKLWLTIISGIVFAHASFTGMLSGEAVASIVSMVFISYFQKREPDGNNKPA